MKPRVGCEACRRRHRKCFFPLGASICHGCAETGRECHVAPKWQFLPAASTHTPARRPDAGAQSPILPQSLGGHAHRIPSPLDTPAAATRSTSDDAPSPRNDKRVRRSEDAQSMAGRPTGHSAIPTSLIGGAAAASGESEAPPLTPSGPSGPSGPLKIGPKLTKREACLLKLYTLKLAPIADACDDARHFALVVPRLALEEPLIINGLLALASLYDALCNETVPDLEATAYHSRCIELLIEAFARPPGTYDSVLLTAIVITRLYEEYHNEIDSQYLHLRGARSLLDHECVARFAAEGGLAEAASWIHLRQALYVSLTMQRPLEISLQTFESFGMLRRRDDAGYANRVIYIFAKILRLFSAPLDDTTSQQTTDGTLGSAEAPIISWESLETELAAWYDTKPITFEPIYQAAEDAQGGKPFPSIWLLTSIPVVALQYYYAGRILFWLHKHNDEEAGDGGLSSNSIRRDPVVKEAISSLLCILMGLALSNDEVANAFYLPSHMLTLCGYCIHDPMKRDGTVKFLQRAHRELQWKTSHLVQRLSAQWSEMDQVYDT